MDQTQLTNDQVEGLGFFGLLAAGFAVMFVVWLLGRLKGDERR